MPTEDRLQVVCLCTGNRARSAMLETFLRVGAGDLPIDVSSAGLLELSASPPLPEALSACERIGVDLSAHRSRSLKDVGLAETDLVLGFERQHIATAVVEADAE